MKWVISQDGCAGGVRAGLGSCSCGDGPRRNMSVVRKLGCSAVCTTASSHYRFTPTLVVLGETGLLGKVASALCAEQVRGLWVTVVARRRLWLCVQPKVAQEAGGS